MRLEDIEDHVLKILCCPAAGVNHMSQHNNTDEYIVELNKFLYEDHSVQELKLVFSMNPRGAVGHDGYTSLFYQSCWEIIAEDLYNAVNEFFYNY